MRINETIGYASAALAAAMMALMLGAVPAGASTREFITSFGSSIEKPGGIAVNLETGNVYVTDRASDTIDVFGPTGGHPIDNVPSQISGGLHFNGFEPNGIAIDNSCYEHQPRLTGQECEEYDPSYGDVFVVDEEREQRGVQKFGRGPDGQYELLDDIGITPMAPLGVALSPEGDLYAVTTIPGTEEVREFKKQIEKINNGGAEEDHELWERIDIPQALERRPAYIAIDGIGDLYLGNEEENGDSSPEWNGVARLQFGPAGNVLSEEVFSGSIQGVARPIAVDVLGGRVYIGEGPEVAEYDQAGSLRLKFGSTIPLGGSLGEGENGVGALAVNGSTGFVYVGNKQPGKIDVFGPVAEPPAIPAVQPPASNVTRTSATIAGVVDPESEHATYYFEYASDSEYDANAGDPYLAGGRTALTALVGGHTAETIERLPLTGLLPGRTYHYRLVSTNGSGTTYGPDETFTTAAPTPPGATTGPASEVTATSAALSGAVAPNGLASSYVFEVGTDTGYDGAKLFGSAGSGLGDVAVSVGLRYLVPGVTYHYRLIATSFDGTTYGQDRSFKTLGVTAGVTQPPSTPLLAGQAMQFPSLTGAVIHRAGKAEHGKRNAKSRRRAETRKCKEKRTPHGKRAICKARARRARAVMINSPRSTGG